MQGLLEAVNRYSTAVGMHINASKTKVMPIHILGEQHQAVLFDDEPNSDVDKFKYLGWPGHRRHLRQVLSCPFRILLSTILSWVTGLNIVAYKEQGLPGSGWIDSALRLRNVASTSDQRKTPSGL